ncbi:hypothetical protein ES703_110740 [subsurface metagenome]
MKHELWYSVVVRDRHGKVISRERRRSRSFLKQWNQLVYVQMAQTSLSIKDTGGTSRSIDPIGTNFKMKADAGNSNYGIRVGTGTTAVAIDDYALETPIAHGTGAGQMSHLVCTVATSVVAAPSCSFLVSRSIVNNSPGVITVREAAIYMRMDDSYYGCAVRDVLTVPQAVPNGGAITIDWTIQVTV